MTSEEADVMRRMLKYCYGASSDVDAVLTEAHQLLAQHADDQIAVDLEWLVENYEGNSIDRGYVMIFTTRFSPAGTRVVFRFESTGVECCIGTWNGEIPTHCTTRGDVRRLPAGLLVAKKKEG